MARVVKADIAVLLEIDDMVWSDAFITMASLLVDEELDESGLSEARLLEIERNLAAHFYCMKDVRASSEGAGGVSVSYAMSVGKGLDATLYGQQAMMFDTSGTLTAINNKKGRNRVLVESINGYDERALIDGKSA